MKRTFALVFALLFTLGIGHAQTYGGAFVGAGSTVVPGLPAFHSSVNLQNDQNSTVGGLFVGHRRGWIGIEAGAFTLPKYRSVVSIGDYPAYREQAGRPMDPNDNTKTADATQRFDGHALYLRAQLYAPQVLGFTPYAFAGMAHATTRNREQATYNGGESSATHDETFSNTAPIYGLGLQRDFGRMSVRVEWLQSRGLQDNPHTLRRTITMATAGVSYRFN